MNVHTDNICCITTYLIGWRHVQHIILFEDGSEIVVDKTIPFWLLLIDRDVIVDWWHVIECGNWS